MASPEFRILDRNLRRKFWLDFVETQLDAAWRAKFRASLVDTPDRGPALAMVGAQTKLHGGGD
jgi:hypothetical protein